MRNTGISRTHLYNQLCIEQQIILSIVIIFSAERQNYYKHTKKAKANPQKYMSIIVDAIDQSKTNLPHFMYESKSMYKMWKLRIYLVGVIIHGVGTYGFFYYFQWSHGSDLTMSILLHCLLMLDNLPKTLYLQMDNCPGQNKNRFVQYCQLQYTI